MGRQANALDWTDEGSGVLRVLEGSVRGRADSEIRLREHATPAEDDADVDGDDEPTRPFERIGEAPHETVRSFCTECGARTWSIVWTVSR